VADFVICPRCRRQNPADAVFCNRCGVRLLHEGVYFRNRDAASAVGMPQLLLGLGVLVLAGLVLGGGAIVLLGSSGPRATPTNIAAGPTGTPLLTSSAPTPSAAFSPTLPPTPTLIATGSPPIVPTPTPSPAPSPTPLPTPTPTPIDCALASQGINVKQFQLGLGHATDKALSKVWCIRNVTIDQWVQWGTAKLFSKNQLVYQATCLPSGCPLPASQAFVPPYQANPGRTLRYEFTCFDDTIATPDVDDCTDAMQQGAVITIDYEPFAAP
jgi:hypothetical protein